MVRGERVVKPGLDLGMGDHVVKMADNVSYSLVKQLNKNLNEWKRIPAIQSNTSPIFEEEVCSVGVGLSDVL